MDAPARQPDPPASSTPPTAAGGPHAGDHSPSTGPHARLRAFFDGFYVNRRNLTAGFREQRRLDAAAHRGHLVVACLFCALSVFPNSFMEVAAVVLIGVFLIRLPRVAGLWIHGVAQPPYLALTLWAAWSLLALLWSPDRQQGLDELANLRWMLIPIALWPVLDGRRWLIAALAVGFLCGHFSQLVHIVGRATEAGWIPFDRQPGRNSGWWDPVVGGTLLCAALGLHLPPALLGRGRSRLFGLIGATLAVLGLLATGTRGAWAGALCLLAVGLAVAAFRARRRLLRPMPLVAAGAAVVVAALVAGLTLREGVGERFSGGVAEVTRVFNEQDFDSDTGGRLLMWRQAGRAFAEHPIAGVGTGGYQAWGREHLGPRETHLVDRVHDHAHSALFHAAATTGVIGAGLGVLVIAAGVWGGLRMNPGERLGGYDAGPAFALLGVALAGVFDTIQVNAQTAGMLGLLLGLCLPVRPRPMGEDEDESRAHLADGIADGLTDEPADPAE